MNTQITTIDTSAIRLKKGDAILSKTGRRFFVTKVEIKTNKVIILFDGDMEIDFAPYDCLPLIKK